MAHFPESNQVLTGRFMVSIRMSAAEYDKLTPDQESVLTESVKKDVKPTLDALAKAVEAQFGHLGIKVVIEDNL